MDSSIAIHVKDLRKNYRIGHAEERYKTFRQAMVDAVMGPLRRLKSFGQASHKSEDSIWALDGVNLDVKKGEVLGVIGRNGAGKTTLLKVLTEITAPTSGRIELRGRVSSLLEVGTGFHPELTGRENIYLNGAILGMGRAEVNAKFDAIVAFAEIAKFIDTPVKRYSSGMYVRLAFAVAAHLEPDILLVDEVLAVGDLEFQKKCLGRMHDVADTGRTILFVSHQMSAIQALCTRVVVMDKGKVLFDGPTADAIAAYAACLQDSDSVLSTRDDITEKHRAWYTDLNFQTPEGKPLSAAISGEPLDIALHYRCRDPGAQLHFAIGVYTNIGEKILHLSTHYSHPEAVRAQEEGVVLCHMPRCPLPGGSYRLNVSLQCGQERVDLVHGAATLDVVQGDYYGTGKLPPPNENKVLIDHTWEI